MLKVTSCVVRLTGCGKLAAAELRVLCERRGKFICCHLGLHDAIAQEGQGLIVVRAP